MPASRALLNGWPLVAGQLPAVLGPATATYVVNAAVGAQIAAITGLQSAERAVSVTPGDGRLAINGTGNALLVGLASATLGTRTYTIGTSSGRSFVIAVTATAASVIVNSQVPLGISGTPHSANVGTAYSYRPSVGGGNGTRAFTMTGTLPPGLSFDATTGTISGTPTTAGTYNHGIGTTTSDGQTATLATRTLTVLAPGQVTLRALFPNMQNGSSGTAYSFGYDTAATAGTKITRIFRRSPGSTLSISPADGKVAIREDADAAYVVVGASPQTTVGALPFYTITETHPNATNSGVTSAWNGYVAAASNAASVASAGYKVAGIGGQVLGESTGDDKITAARTRFKFYVRHKLGRATYTSLRVAFSNWRIAATSDQEELTPPADTTVSQVWAYIPGAPISMVQMTHGGQTSRTVGRGVDYDFYDELTPAMFGLTQFDDSTELWLKGYGDRAAGAVVYIPATTQFGASQQFWYDPANEPAGAGAVPNDISTPGPFTTAPSGNAATAVFVPTMVVGLQKAGDPVIPSVLVVGDSLTQRLSDLGGDGELGGGGVVRGLFAVGLPYYRNAIGGRGAYHWNNNNYKGKTAIPFANTGIIPLVTNDLSNQSTAPVALDDLSAMYAQFRVGGITRIIGATSGPRVSAGYLASGSNVLTNFRATDLNNQFPYATGLPSGLGFEKGGTKDIFNAALKARVGQSNGPDALVDWGAIVADANDNSKFAVRPFATTLAAAVAAGSDTLVLNAEPELYEGLILEPGTSASDGNGASPVNAAGNYPLYVLSKTNNGNGTWTVKTTRNGPYASNLFEGLLTAAAHPVGAVVRATGAMDETHAMMLSHIAAGQQYAAILFGYYPAYAFSNAEAQSYVARHTSPPSDKFRRAVDAYVGSLKTSGVWAKLDTQYVLVAPSKQGAYLNLKSASYTMTDGGTAPTHAPGKGVTGNGTNAYATTNFNPSTAGGLFQQDNAHASIYVLGDTANTNFDMTAQNARLRIRSASGTGAAWRIGTSAANVAANPGTASAPRNMLANRTGASASGLFINGAADATSAAASNGNSSTLDLMRDNASGTYSDRTIMLASAGSGLTAAEASAKHSADRALLQALGAVA